MDHLMSCCRSSHTGKRIIMLLLSAYRIYTIKAINDTAKLLCVLGLRLWGFRGEPSGRD